jgi:pyruvate dehydrogenase E1 component beta subunit
MPAMNLVQAITSALDYKLADDPNVLVFGEDTGLEGGVFRVTQGLQEKHGERRVFDTPLSESVIMGAGLGMAVAGLRPVLEIQFCGFIYPAMNQLVTHVARMRNRTRGVFTVPLTVRLPYGGGIQALELHSESMEAMLAHVPGLQVVIPSTPYDAKGLLISAIESEDPVLFLEPKKVYRAFRQEVPEEPYRIPLGKASVVLAGTRITLVAYGAMMRVARQAVELAAKEGISVELVDLRSIYPLDSETLLDSVRKTGRLAVLHEGPTSFGVAAEVIARVNEEALYWLEAPPRRITGFDTIMPLPMGEHHYMPTPERVLYELIQLHNTAE